MSAPVRAQTQKMDERVVEWLDAALLHIAAEEDEANVRRRTLEVLNDLLGADEDSRAL